MKQCLNVGAIKGIFKLHGVICIVEDTLLLKKIANSKFLELIEEIGKKEC